MSNKKNIDRLFQEKFKDFEVTPNDAVWNRISESLPQKKKKRRVIALWWQIGGVAAAVALLLTVGVSLFNSDPAVNQDTPIVDTDNKEKVTPTLEDTNVQNKTNLQNKQEDLKTTNESKSKVAEVDTNSSENQTEDNFTTTKQSNGDKVKKLISGSSQKSKVAENTKTDELSNTPIKSNGILKNTNKDATTKVASNSTKENTNKIQNDNNAVISNKEIKDVIKNEVNKTKEAVVGNNSSEKDNVAQNSNASNNKDENTTTLVEDINKESIEDAIAANNKTNNEKEKDKQNRWSIAPNVAPVYFSSLGQGSPVHSQFNENAKSSDVNMSYGIAGSYAINDRLKVRAGVNRVNLNYTTSDVIGFIGSEAVSRGVSAQFSNLDFSSGVQSVSLVSSSMINRATMPDAFNTQFVGDLDQRFGFIEVPLELEYRLIDKRFGVNFIGGFSTFFLSENEIFANINGNSTLIGEANNINSTSFSANLGLGLDYSLSKQWNFNLEPTFKYQLNTFNNTSGNFRPFFIGVYTGVSFKF